jgi:hypothetical protein
MKHNVLLITKPTEHVLNTSWKKIIAILFKLIVMLTVMFLKMILMDFINNKLSDNRSEVIVNVP